MVQKKSRGESGASVKDTDNASNRKETRNLQGEGKNIRTPLSRLMHIKCPRRSRTEQLVLMKRVMKWYDR